MAPNTATTSALLRQTIYYHLDNLSYDNALFFSERLLAFDPAAESTYLVALCHFRIGDLRSAHESSRQYGYRGQHLGCAFVFAQTCYDLERYKEGITALEKARGLWTARNNMGKHTSSSRMPYPDAAAIHCLLGRLYRAYDDKKKAITCFEDALRSNPFMWDAFTILCDMGVDIRVPNVFRATDSFARNFDHERSLPDAPFGPSFTAQPLEPLQKKSVAQAINQDNDPFDFHRPSAFQDNGSSSNNALFAEVENDLMAKIAAAQSRYPTTQASKQGADSMATPPAAPAVAPEPQPTRANYPSEPPQAPARRTRAAPPPDPATTDGPPRMSYRLGTRRREKGQEQTSDLSDAVTKSSTLSSSVTERKRTASGHPVQGRAVNGEEPRRSARLNVFPRSAASRMAATTSASGAPSNRELKKARPQISRIMRPGSSGSNVGRVVSGNRKPMDEGNMDVDHVEAPRLKEPPVAQPPLPRVVEQPESSRVDESLKLIMELLKKMASGYLLSSQFKCQEALNVFMSIPRTQQDTPWVLAQMARAHYEQANHVEAEKYFRRLRIQAPTRHEDMEVYSTVLWLLRKETDLSFLAHELVDAAWDSPQAWCALGNAWSLACDHEQALRCFKRAIQLHPKFAYAYTLQGHEHFENEEYDRALTSYRHAISADRRHYNAYYGIGKVYEKLGNYDKALVHYDSALKIHPKNAVLNCCIGTVLQRQKHTGQALAYFNTAAQLQPKAPDFRLRKARALLATGKLREAQQELLILKDLAPDKAQVHYLLGKMAKAMRDKKAAVRHFTIALSLDPKVCFFGTYEDTSAADTFPGEPRDQARD